MGLGCGCWLLQCGATCALLNPSELRMPLALGIVVGDWAAVGGHTGLVAKCAESISQSFFYRSENEANSLAHKKSESSSNALEGTSL